MFLLWFFLSYLETFKQHVHLQSKKWNPVLKTLTNKKVHLQETILYLSWNIIRFKSCPVDSVDLGNLSSFLEINLSISAIQNETHPALHTFLVTIRQTYILNAPNKSITLLRERNQPPSSTDAMKVGVHLNMEWWFFKFSFHFGDFSGSKPIYTHTHTCMNTKRQFNICQRKRKWLHRELNVTFLSFHLKIWFSERKLSCLYQQNCLP